MFREVINITNIKCDKHEIINRMKGHFIYNSKPEKANPSIETSFLIHNFPLLYNGHKNIIVIS